MRLSDPRFAALLALGVVLLGQPAIAQPDGQSPPVSGQSISGEAASGKDGALAPQPPKNLPADFIDSRPIFAYFDDRPMPDTVRGLLEDLQRPDRCGKAAVLRTEEACALVFYRLDAEFTPDRLRPPLIMKAIYRITSPEDPANTVMLIPDGTGDLKRFTGEGLFEPLRNIRANVCLQDKRMPDKCRATNSKGVLYRPYGILGARENDREDILPVKSAHKHFQLNLKPADAEWLKQQELLDLCLQHITCP
jgi:hypothetical protein